MYRKVGLVSFLFCCWIELDLSHLYIIHTIFVSQVSQTCGQDAACVHVCCGNEGRRCRPADEIQVTLMVTMTVTALAFIIPHHDSGGGATSRSSSKGQPCRSPNFHHASHPKPLTIPQLCLDHFRHEFVEAACEAPSVVCF